MPPAGTSTFSTFVHADGAKMAYEIFGAGHIGLRVPLVLVNGMSMIRGDWHRLVDSVSQIRPVLIFDHRGMSDSTLSTPRTEVITLGSMARDLLALLSHLNWKEVAICGYSMGGVVTQQLLFLPYHPTQPTPLSFRVTHAFLTATLCEKQKDNSFGKRLTQIPPPKNGVKRTFEEKREIARPTATLTFDPKWIGENPERFNWWLDRMTLGRPVQTILMQARTLGRINFEGLHANLQASDTKIFVVHGDLDQVVSYSASREILKRMPWAKDAEIGTKPGQIPSLSFGHQWFEYFDISVWRDVIEVFLDDPPRLQLSRL